MSDEYNQKLEAVKLLEKRRTLEKDLPHLYAFKPYSWATRFKEAKDRFIFLFAPNQVGKSICAISLCIDWATDKRKWPTISRDKIPTLIFYFYPNLRLARREIDHKWVPKLLPRGDMKDHAIYGWDLIDNKDKLSIKFRSGIEVVFCGYSQGKSDLLAIAASSPMAVFIDEEMDPELWPEVTSRLEATKGSLRFCCTPVHCYSLYREIQNGKRKIPNSLIITVSLWECLKFADGSRGEYTREDILNRIATLPSKAEVDKRVYGKMVAPEGMRFPGFTREKNYVKPEKIPDGWFYVSGIDVGSGGINGHPAAISIVAVAPDYSSARVVRFWRGDDIQTTSPIILEYYESLKEGIGITLGHYDGASAEMGITAQNQGTPLIRADKSSGGYDILNSLFMCGMLLIEESEEAEKLCTELESLTIKPGSNRKDDGSDSLRYAISALPWKFENKYKPLKSDPANDDREKHKYSRDIVASSVMTDGVEEEIKLWNEYLEG